MEGEIILPETTVRAMISLLSDVAALNGNIAAKRKHLMDGLCVLTKADSWYWTMMGDIETEKAPAHTIFLKNGFSDHEFSAYLKTQEHPDMKWMTAPFLEALNHSEGQITRLGSQVTSLDRLSQSSILPLLLEAGIGQVILSGRPTSSGQLSVIVMGRKGGRDDFTLLESRIAHILLSEVRWLHDESWPEHPREGISNLSPRLRTVLTLLLQGCGRKQIASDLEISIHTLGDYVKELYAVFGVHSQAELLRRFVEGDGGDLTP